MAKKEEETILAVAQRIMDRYNVIESKKRMNYSYGIALYDNGMMVKVLKNFDYVAESWKLLKQAKALDNNDLVKIILTENTDGGIIDTGDVMLDLNRISVMYPVYRANDELIKERDELYERDDEINEFLYGSLYDDDE